MRVFFWALILHRSRPSNCFDIGTGYSTFHYSDRILDCLSVCSFDLFSIAKYFSKRFSSLIHLNLISKLSTVPHFKPISKYHTSSTKNNLLFIFQNGSLKILWYYHVNA